MYWSSIYGHVLDLVAHDPVVRDATLVVRHEDLCARPHDTIDRILDHAGLDATSFGDARERYAHTLHAPRYYRATLDDAELCDLTETTAETATRLGYHDHDHDHEPAPSQPSLAIEPTRPIA